MRSHAMRGLLAAPSGGGGGGGLHPDVAAWVAATEALDGQALEVEFVTALDDFVKACVGASLWDDMRLVYCFCGPRTLASILIPLKTPGADQGTPGYEGFLQSHYNRGTGLKGDNNRIIDTQVSQIAAGIGDADLHAYANTVTDGVFGASPVSLFGTCNFTTPSNINIGVGVFGTYYCRSLSVDVLREGIPGNGGHGISRTNLNDTYALLPGFTGTLLQTSQGAVTNQFTIFGDRVSPTNTGSMQSEYRGRMNFFSAGPALNGVNENLDVLDGLVQTFTTTVIALGLT